MFASTAMEVGIGLIFVFLIFSLILTATAELIESIFRNRAVDLQRALSELVGDHAARTALMSHGMLFGLYRGAPDLPTDDHLKPWRVWRKVGHLPSYMPKESFAKALIDLTKSTAGDRSAPKITMSTPLESALSAMQAQTRENPALMQAEVERWYDATMDRATGWFKRRTQAILFAIGLITAVALNLNAVSIARHLEARPEARAAVLVAASAAATAGAQVPAATPEAIAAELGRLTDTNLPMGWPRTGSFDQKFETARAAAGGLVPLLFGWLIMAAAGTLGGPFWFDLLSKVMQVRSALKPADTPAGKVDKSVAQGTAVGSTDLRDSVVRDPSIVDRR